jgi:hypothetical protein
MFKQRALPPVVFLVIEMVKDLVILETHVEIEV